MYVTFLLLQVRDKWSFQMTARHDLYADLFARYTRHDFQPQHVYDDHRRK
jgi:beta-ureidopropionase